MAFAWAWLYGEYSDTQCLNFLDGLPEPTAWHEEASLWPPGGACVMELPDGTVQTRDGPIPWYEWAFLALCALFAWLSSAAWHRLVRRVHSRPRPE